MEQKRLLELAGIQLNEASDEVHVVIYTELGGSSVSILGIYDSKETAEKRQEAMEEEYGEDVHVISVSTNSDIEKSVT